MKAVIVRWRKAEDCETRAFEGFVQGRIGRYVEQIRDIKILPLDPKKGGMWMNGPNPVFNKPSAYQNALAISIDVYTVNLQSAELHIPFSSLAFSTGRASGLSFLDRRPPNIQTSLSKM